MRPERAATAAAEPTSRFFDAPGLITTDLTSGLKLHYLDWGGDPRRHTLVLLHGGAAHAHWWDLVAPQLTPLGRVVALDFRGHGESAWAIPPHYGPQAYVEDLRALIEHLGTRPIVIGHSMGGAVVQWAASRFPELMRAIVLVDSPNGPPPLLRRLMWRWRRRARGVGERPELDSAEAIVRKFRFSPPDTYLSREAMARLALAGAEQLPNGRWAFRFDPHTRQWRRIGGGLRRPRLRDIKLPTLILRGAQSGLVSAHSARVMHRKIRGSIYIEIPRAFHHVPLDNPDPTAAAIAEFVQRF
ncbi:MAG: alpha/beta fold hydrolase [Candidatus Binatales bacterium]